VADIKKTIFITCFSIILCLGAITSLAFPAAADNLEGSRDDKQVAGEVEISGFTIEGILIVNKDGEVKNDILLKAADGMITLEVPAKTVLLDADYRPLQELTANVIQGPSALPSRETLLACEFGPPGAHLFPPLSVTLSYDPASLTSGIQENSLHIAVWNGSSWLPLESLADTIAHTVTAQLDYLSIYALQGEIVEAAPLPKETPAETVNPISFPISTDSPPEDNLPLQDEKYLAETPVLQPDTVIDTALTEERDGLPIPILLVIYLSVFSVMAFFTVLFILRRSRSI